MTSAALAHAGLVGRGASGRTELTEVSARGFRNLGAITAAIPAEGVVLVGENGQGKTNFLEAIRYLTILRSARGASDADLVRHGEDGFHVAATARSGGERTVSAGFSPTLRKKKIVVDGVVATRLSDAFGAIHTVLLSPSDSRLVAGGPGERRRYLDVLLSLLDARYLASLQRYRSALLRRNAALREVSRSGGDPEQAAVWEPILAHEGALLWRKRAEWCDAAAPSLARVCSELGEPGSTLLSHARHSSGASCDAGDLLAALASHRAVDIRRGSTGIGPHRDDLLVTLDGRELRLFGSGGQQRTTAAAFRILEALAIGEAYERFPVLLLDDPFAELDARRAARILKVVRESIPAQVILAVPREEDVPGALAGLVTWRISAGAIGVKNG